MTKQEKIRKFISLYLRQRFTTDEMPEDECDSETEFILRYLHEQDVVIKVKRGLPTISSLTCRHPIAVRQECPLLEAGYVAVESLIKV